MLLRWFAPDELDRLRLSPATRDLIRRHAAENPPDVKQAAAPAVWGTGQPTVLNGTESTFPRRRRRPVLLGLRHPDSMYAGDTWHYLAGGASRNRPACLVREAREEAGLVIDPADVELLHVAHVVDTPGGLPLMQLVFNARRWKGEPKVREPDKCLPWQWWPRHELPAPDRPYTRTAIAASPKAAPTPRSAGEQREHTPPREGPVRAQARGGKRLEEPGVHAMPRAEPPTSSGPSLWGHEDFRRYLTGQPRV